MTPPPPYTCWLCGRPAEHAELSSTGWRSPMQTIRGFAVCEARFCAVDDVTTEAVA